MSFQETRWREYVQHFGFHFIREVNRQFKTCCLSTTININVEYTVRLLSLSNGSYQNKGFEEQYILRTCSFWIICLRPLKHQIYSISVVTAQE